MSPLTPPVGSNKEFVPHPPGSYLAVCADVYVKVDDNPFFGKIGLNGRPNTERTRTRCSIVFLSEHTMLDEVTGQQKLMQVNVWNKYGWGTLEYPSNLRKFIKGWFPTATDAQIEAMDLTKLVGRGANLIISHTMKEGKTYVNVLATPVPAGAIVPRIPFDFATHEQKMQFGGAPAPNSIPLPSGGAPLAPPQSPPPIQQQPPSAAKQLLDIGPPPEYDDLPFN